MAIIPPDFPEQDRMKALIEQLDSYISHYHGGAVELISYEEDTVKVRLGGAVWVARYHR